MVSILVALIFIAATIYIALIFDSVSLTLLGISLVVLLLLSIFYVIYIRFHLKIEIDIPIPVVESSKDYALVIKVTNTGILPFGRLRLKVSYGDEKGKYKRKMDVESRVHGTEINRYKLLSEVVGCYECALMKVRISSPLGLVRISKKLSGSAKIIVIPSAHALAITVGEGVRHFIADADVVDDLSPGKDQTEIFDVREFRDGDKLQKVHWKLSAKADELLVKENAEPKPCAVVIFAGYDEAEKGALMKWVSSVSYNLFDLGLPHFVAYYSKSRNEIVRTRVADEETYYNCLINYVQDVDKLNEYDMEELYKEKYKGEVYLHKIMMTRLSEVALDDELLDTSSEMKFEMIIR